MFEFFKKNSVKGAIAPQSHLPSANWFFVFGIVLVVSMLGLSVFQHELVHSQINEKAGVESELKLALYDGWIPAIGVQRLNAPTKEISNYDALHLQNEIINYNLFPSLIGIMVIMLIGFVYIGDRLGDKK